MAYTQADLDAIDAEIASLRTVKATAFGDQSTTFRNLDELYKERDRIARAIDGSSAPPRGRFAVTTKGF